VTTIAADADAGVMASDSLWSDGDECGACRKVFRVRRALLGLAGGLAEIRSWLEAYRRRDVPPSMEADFDDLVVMRLDSSGLATWDNTSGWVALSERRYAIGSGGKCARGALEAGADCRRAVQIAVSIDAGSKGAARVYRLGAH
jgi:ATP-dependent protease HslVU (ClpYQ) peptidase subunit